jgi:hypothetical protein
MTEFKHQSVEVPSLDQTYENFDKWLKWVAEKRAELDLLHLQQMLRDAKAGEHLKHPLDTTCGGLYAPHTISNGDAT